MSHRLAASSKAGEFILVLDNATALSASSLTCRLSLSTILSSTSASTATATSVTATATSATTATTSVREVNLFLLDALEAEEFRTAAGGNRVHISASHFVSAGDDAELLGLVIEDLLLGVLDVFTSSLLLHELVVGLFGLVISKVDTGEGLLVFLGGLFLFFTALSLGESLLLVFGLGLLFSFLLLDFTFDLFLGDGGSSLGISILVASTTGSVTALSLDFLSDSSRVFVHGVPLLTGLSLESFDLSLTATVVFGPLALATLDSLGSAVVSGASVLGAATSATLAITATATLAITATTTAAFTVTASAVGTATTTLGLGAVTTLTTFAGATATTSSAGTVATTVATTTATSTAATASAAIVITSTVTLVDVETTLFELGISEDGLLSLELDLLLFAVATALLLLLLGGSGDNRRSTLLNLGLE